MKCPTSRPDHRSSSPPGSGGDLLPDSTRQARKLQIIRNQKNLGTADRESYSLPSCQRPWKLLSAPERGVRTIFPHFSVSVFSFSILPAPASGGRCSRGGPGRLAGRQVRAPPLDPSCPHSSPGFRPIINQVQPCTNPHQARIAAPALKIMIGRHYIFESSEWVAACQSSP